MPVDRRAPSVTMDAQYFWQPTIWPQAMGEGGGFKGRGGLSAT